MPHRPTTQPPDEGPNTSTITAGCPALRPAARKVSRARRAPSPLEVIPGVGVATVEDLNRLGIFEVEQLKDRDPQRMYDDISRLDGVKHDRCVLYVFRCAVYYASQPRHDPEKLKWWNWKDS